MVQSNSLKVGTKWVAISYSRGSPNSGIKHRSPEFLELAGRFDTTVPPGKPKHPLPDDKYKVAHPCSEILLDIEKEWRIDMCYNIDEPWKHFANWKKPWTNGGILLRFHLYEISRLSMSIERESWLMVA